MGRVCTHMTMSLDGFIADPQDGVSELFGWYEAGPVAGPSFAASVPEGIAAAKEAAGPPT